MQIETAFQVRESPHGYFDCFLELPGLGNSEVDRVAYVGRVLSIVSPVGRKYQVCPRSCFQEQMSFEEHEAIALCLHLSLSNALDFLVNLYNRYYSGVFEPLTHGTDSLESLPFTDPPIPIGGS